MQSKKTTLLPRMDLVTILIILAFVLMTIGVIVYFKQRISAIDEELKRQRSYQVGETTKAFFHPGHV